MSLLPENLSYSSSYERARDDSWPFTGKLSHPAKRKTPIAATAYNALIEAQ